jgi:dolichol-phosphate mannosyltransferase
MLSWCWQGGEGMRETLSIIVSAYNEEGNIKELYRQLKEAVVELPLKAVEIIFVDDGSKDRTLLYCHELQQQDSAVAIVKLARNFGHEIAMRAGMDYAKGEAVIFMDADLQHPPAYIRQMVTMWQSGKDIVLTKRADNKGASKTHGLWGGLFYRLINFLSDVEIPRNAPDFRLIDRKYVSYVQAFNERDSLFRGILSLVTSLKADNIGMIEFNAPKRIAGESSYTFLRYVKLAIDSILQFSVRPLYLSLWLAIVTGMLACSLGVYVIVEHYVLKHPTPGYATIVAAIVFMGSMNLFVLAIIGAYVGKIHMETKKRPLYFAELITGGAGNAGQNH